MTNTLVRMSIACVVSVSIDTRVLDTPILSQSKVDSLVLAEMLAMQARRCLWPTVLEENCKVLHGWKRLQCRLECEPLWERPAAFSRVSTNLLEGANQTGDARPPCLFPDVWHSFDAVHALADVIQELMSGKTTFSQFAAVDDSSQGKTVRQLYLWTALPCDFSCNFAYKTWPRVCSHGMLQQNDMW